MAQARAGAVNRTTREESSRPDTSGLHGAQDGAPALAVGSSEATSGQRSCTSGCALPASGLGVGAGRRAGDTSLFWCNTKEMV